MERGRDMVSQRFWHQVWMWTKSRNRLIWLKKHIICKKHHYGLAHLLFPSRFAQEYVPYAVLIIRKEVDASWFFWLGVPWSLRTSIRRKSQFLSTKGQDQAATGITYSKQCHWLSESSICPNADTFVSRKMACKNGNSPYILDFSAIIMEDQGYHPTNSPNEDIKEFLHSFNNCPELGLLGGQG